MSCSATAQVVGREKVTTKAGTFDTLRIKVSVTIRTVGAALREIEFWHAPEIGRPVRYAMRTFGGSGYSINLTDPNVAYELVAYQSGATGSGQMDAALASSGTEATPTPILVASASPARGAIQMQGPAAPKVGDRWEYELRDLSNSRTTRQRIDVGAVGADGILENVSSDGVGSVTLQHGPGAYLSGAAFVQFSPYLQAYGALDPSAVGGDIPVTRLSDCEGLRSCTIKARVVGRERITVPAGAFDAVKLEIAVVVVNDGTSYAMMRNATIEIHVWYAAEARRVVRMVGTVFGPAALMPNFELTLQSLRLQ